MKKILNYIFTLGAIALLGSCSLDEVDNPNAPTFQSFEDGATQADVRLLAVGLEAVMRNDLEFHYQTISIIGREYYDLTGVDPRFTGELLKGPLDNNGFLTTRAYAAWYKIVQSANLLEKAVVNSSAGFDNSIISGYLGYAKTMKAYGLLMNANRQYTNGIRVDVADPNNLGPIVSYENALSAIMTLLNEANSDLASAGDAFDFTLSSGFAGFDTPETFAQFNRALGARVAIYQNDKNTALSMLNNSFLDLDGDLDAGPAHVFGLTGNDIANAQFYIQDQSGQEFMVHDSWLAAAEAGDARVTSKSDPYAGGRVNFDGLTGINQVFLYKSNTDPVSIIRNEELILLYAEAQIGNNNAEAVNAINVVRTAAEIGPYAGQINPAALTDEVLQQRRYSLFGEGHRWIDLRRFDRLNEIPLDRAGDNPIAMFPTPVTENAVLGN